MTDYEIYNRLSREMLTAVNISFSLSQFLLIKSSTCRLLLCTFLDFYPFEVMSLCPGKFVSSLTFIYLLYIRNKKTI